MVNPFGNLGNIGNLMKQAKELQEKMQQAQQELAAMKIEGVAGGGLVKLTVSGNGDALSINIDDAVFNEDKKVLQGLIVAAINDASNKRETHKKATIGSLMSGLGLPENFNLPGV